MSPVATGLDRLDARKPPNDSLIRIGTMSIPVTVAAGGVTSDAGVADLPVYVDTAAAPLALPVVAAADGPPRAYQAAQSAAAVLHAARSAAEQITIPEAKTAALDTIANSWVRLAVALATHQMPVPPPDTDR